MIKKIVGLGLLLIGFEAGATSPPQPAPDIFNECYPSSLIKLEAEFDIPKYKKFHIPKGESFKKCFQVSGHSDDVGLLVVRTSVTNNDKISVVKGPYNLLSKGKPNISLAMKNVSREVFNLSDSFGARQDATLYPLFSVAPSTEERTIVFGYELTDKGSLALTVGVTTDEPVKYVPNKEEQLSPQYSSGIGEVDIPKYLNSEGVVSGVDSSLFYGAKGSNAGNCPVNSLPPANINQVAPLNGSLAIIESQKGSYYSDNPAIQKGIDMFFQGGADQKYASKSALATTAFLVADKYKDNNDQYSFVIGAAAKVAGSSSPAALLGTVGGNINNDLVNKGSNYAKHYLKDSNRHNIKDSCDREPVETPGKCTVPERHKDFSMVSTSAVKYEQYPFDYGEGVDLLFEIDAFEKPDDFWLVATGGDTYPSRRILEVRNLRYKMTQSFFNYSTKASGEIYMNASARESSSAISIKVTCTVSKSNSHSKDDNIIIIPPPQEPIEVM
ncbi:hypothetical protein BCU84_19525 [Shewanella sp. 10N.286.51.B7]|uniref:hypothetical protein n=1 Tax=unclassified Shewanella TaxID=196818 RepID=UPI0006D6692C|nr:MULTISPECIES: hypothetical protein [unclassified Shewanella]KPZ67248.1 hypothetical protein AN944_04157 [Shewanella sp. P1-14-1]PMG73010.1 hypothetical protein BCU84_19525 [Shewanella sp. 10N.286.51.B7]